MIQPILEGKELDEVTLKEIARRYEELYKKEVILRRKKVCYKKGIINFMLSHDNRRKEMDALWALIELYCLDGGK